MLVRVDSSRERKPCQPSAACVVSENRCHRSATRILPVFRFVNRPWGLGETPWYRRHRGPVFKIDCVYLNRLPKPACGCCEDLHVRFCHGARYCLPVVLAPTVPGMNSPVAQPALTSVCGAHRCEDATATGPGKYFRFWVLVCSFGGWFPLPAR